MKKNDFLSDDFIKFIDDGINPNATIFLSIKVSIEYLTYRH